MHASRAFVLAVVTPALFQASVFAADWPMWRCTPERSAASDEELSDELQLVWTRELSPRRQTWDDPLNLDLMSFDRVFEPIVLDGRLFVGFNDADKLVAYDAQTGETLWTFFTEAPVRLPPAGWQDKIYFCSDDGFLYCVNAADGQLIWRFSGAPSAQLAIGNQRLTSAWPARGGPVLRDGTVYFAASIWPFMGTFICALDAISGEVQWINDSTGSQFVKQPHSAPSFAGVAPQGVLVATDENLIVPGGRSVPAVLNRADGSLRYFEINAGGKGTGGSFVAANDRSFFVHTRVKGTREFDLESGLKSAFMPNEPVLSDDRVYSAELNGKQPVVRAYDADDQLLWEIAADGRGDLILAGSRLYAAGSESITAIALPRVDEDAEVVWSLPVAGQVERLLAADGSLFAVTLEGQIMAFAPQSDDAGNAITHTETRLPLSRATTAQAQLADLLKLADAEGYAYWFGASDEELLDALTVDSPFVQVAVVDQSRSRIEELRRKWDAAGMYGRLTAHCADPQQFLPPKYTANLVVVGSELVASRDATLLQSLYEAVRPYGGVMYVMAETGRDQLQAAIESLQLEQAQIELAEHGVVVRRVGALPGAADWTHQHGDIANTIKSNDRRVKLPLGILWFGGSSNMDVLPRHGHGPPEQVVGGRLFIQGMNSLSARDVYTGRVLWKREFDELGTFDVYYDHTYENTPLNPKYNQVHIPGANGRGTNYVVTEDRVYLLEGAVCHVLDPATGKTLLDISIASEGSNEEWGYIGVYENVLIGGLGFANYRERHDVTLLTDKLLKGSRAGFGSKSFDRAASTALVGFDRVTGRRLWKVDARHSFWHNGIVAGGGRVYCLDRNPIVIDDVLKRRGKARPDSYRIVAFDVQTGKTLWENQDNVFGTWLGYSEAHDLLLQAGAAASDRLTVEAVDGMAVYAGKDGSIQWQNESVRYAGPCILHNEWIITNANSYTESAGAFRLMDGEQKMIPNPLTGELQPWRLTRAYGCNNIIASENLLTFRSGAAGFYDLLSDSGTGNFGGFKSGCTSNLVVANGVLNAPDYTRTCSCAYQNQTSLALIHMPEVEMWSINSAAAVESSRAEIRRLGINFGAPGDRRDANGLLWLEYPAVAGPSPPLSIALNDDAKPYQQHSSEFSGHDASWILASGIEGISDLRIRLQIADDISLADGIPVNHSADDAEEAENGGVDLSSSDLELVDDGGQQLVGVRFNDVRLRRGAKVRAASIQFTCDEPSDEPTSLLIGIEESSTPSRFSQNPHDLSSRTLSRQQVAWNPPAWNRAEESGAAQRTPDLAALVQSVIDRPDWEAGNSLVFLIGGTGKRVAVASRGKAGDAARLVIDAEDVPEKEPSSSETAVYRVRLFFATPSNSQAADASRIVFDVEVEGQRLLEDVTLDPSGPDDERYAVRTLEDVQIDHELHVRLFPREGTPCLSGISIEERSGK